MRRGPAKCWCNAISPRTLREVAEGGRDAFYEGEIAARLVAYVERAGGLLSRSDLAAYRAEWQEPIGVDYKGHRILECPPNGQGLAALIALEALSDVDFSTHSRDSPECWHLLIEAMKHAMIQAQDHVADPRFADVPVERLLASCAQAAGMDCVCAHGRRRGDAPIRSTSRQPTRTATPFRSSTACTTISAPDMSPRASAS